MLKKFTLLCSAILICTITYGQKTDTLPNYSFENWSDAIDNDSGQEEPLFYLTSDAIVTLFAGVPSPLDQVKKTLFSKTGLYAIEMTSDTLFFPGAGTFKVPGLIISGEDPSQFQQNNLGVAMPKKPKNLKGYFKYEGKGDSCLIAINMFKWNTSKKRRDTVGGGVFITGDTVTSYKEFNIDINYLPNFMGIPDTMSIIALSSLYDMNNPDAHHFTAGAKLTLDSLSSDFFTVALFTTNPTKNFKAGTPIAFTNASSGPYDSLKWVFPDTMTTSPNPTYTFKHGGSYDVTLNLYNKKDSVLASYKKTFNVQSVGIKEVQNTQEEITGLYPNPSNSSAILTYKLYQQENVIVKISDITGRIIRVYNEGAKTGLNKLFINTMEFPNGLYFVNLSQNGKASTQKLTVVH